MQFTSIFSATPKPLLICFSHLRWDFVYQRPQHLMTRAAHHFDVIFLEEPLTAEGGSANIVERKDSSGVTIAVPHVPAGADVDATLAKLLNSLLRSRGENRRRVFWYYTPMALSFSRQLWADATVYDNMDELSLFRGASAELCALEEELLSRADIVFTGGVSLFEAKAHRHSNIRAFPSSIDAPHFNAARTLEDSMPDQRDLPRPRLGFFGVIDERLDIDLVKELAAARPTWQLVMIGPVVKIDPATLPQAANIHWLGMRSYEQLPAYLAGWDVGIMPFALNDATRFISPTKTPEFLAAGVPVVSTPIQDVVRPYGENGLVDIAATSEEFGACCEKLMQQPAGPRLHKVDAFLKFMSWDQTWDDMQAHIASALHSNVVPFRAGKAADNV